MAKVLRIINRLNLGGPTYNVAYLSKYLAPEFETLLVAGIKEDSEESSEFIVKKLGLTPHFIQEMRREINFNNDYQAYKKIKELIQDFKPDIVHTHAAKAGTLGRLAAIHTGVPVILHTFHGHVFHSYFNKYKTSIYKIIERYLAKKSTGIIAISDIQKSELCNDHKICDAEKIHVIPLGFDLTRFEGKLGVRENFRKVYNIESDTLLIGIIGRLVPIKNHELFIRSFSNVKKSLPDKQIKAMVIGDGEDKDKLMALCSELGLKIGSNGQYESDADIIFTSWILEIEEALKALDIVALTSLNEGTPVSLIEAQASGTPIVSTDVGGISNVVIPGKSALLSQSNDIQLFTDNLKKMVQDDNLREVMALQGRDFVFNRFGYERLVEDTRKLYRILLEN